MPYAALGSADNGAIPDAEDEAQTLCESWCIGEQLQIRFKDSSSRPILDYLISLLTFSCPQLVWSSPGRLDVLAQAQLAKFGKNP
jgi:hypothetical protein